MRSVSDDVRSAALALLALVGGSLAAQLVRHDYWDVGTWAVALGVWLLLGVLWLAVQHRRRPRRPPG